MISQTDRTVIRELASQWMEFAALPVMNERRRLWRAVHDLRAERPVILLETVYSRKPRPAHISGPHPDWELLEKDMRATYAAARDSNLEILFRDVYTINGDRPRLRRWVDMTRSIIGM